MEKTGTVGRKTLYINIFNERRCYVQLQVSGPVISIEPEIRKF